MCSYNVQDVRLLERLFHKLRPWIKNMPNHGLHNPDDAEVCPKCGSDTYQRRGMEAFQPWEDRPTRLLTFYEVPPDVVRRPAALRAWAAKAIAAARRAKARKQN